MRSVRVVIVNYRTPELTARAAVSALASARAYEETACGKATVTVVDNSDDGRTADLAELCPGCEVVPTRGNPGFGAGVNAGVALGHEDLVALVNSDAVVEEPFLAELARAFDDPSVGAATALLLLEERGPGGEILVNSTGNVLDSSGNGMDRDWRRPLGSWSAPPQVEGFASPERGRVTPAPTRPPGSPGRCASRRPRTQPRASAPHWRGGPVTARRT